MSDVWGDVAARLDPVDDPYLADPGRWVAERLNEFLWSKQREIVASVAANRRTAVKSCHGVGKSYSAARLACWWLDVHPPGSAFVVTSAPTFPQVRAILWREINKAHRKAGLPGSVNQTEWWLHGELVAFGRKPADYDDQAFQGIHAEFVLVILDEACGIPEQLWVAANSLISNEGCRILAIGNPDDPTSYFFRVCRPGSGWNVLRVSAFDSPNFTDEQVPAALRRVLVSQTYVDEMVLDVGEGSPIWTSKVLGEFAEDHEQAVVMGSKLAACRRPGREHEPDELLPVELGVDVGGSEKGDRTVIRERRGVKAGRVWRMRSSEAERVADKVLAAIVESGATVVKIDSIGIGWGVAGMLSRWRDEGRHRAVIVKVNVGSASTRPKRFPKLRDQIWWEVGRQLSETGGWDLERIDDRTAADLCAPRWSPDSAGRIKVEPKDVTRERLGRSPDDADALLLAYFAAGYGQGTLHNPARSAPILGPGWSSAGALRIQRPRRGL